MADATNSDFFEPSQHDNAARNSQIPSTSSNDQMDFSFMTYSPLEESRVLHNYAVYLGQIEGSSQLNPLELVPLAKATSIVQPVAAVAAAANALIADGQQMLAAHPEPCVTKAATSTTTDPDVVKLNNKRAADKRYHEKKKKEQAEMKMKNGELAEENKSLRAENEDSNGKNESLRRENERLIGENWDSNGRNESLRRENERLMGENRELRSENESLKQANDSQTKTIHQLSINHGKSEFNLNELAASVQNLTQLLANRDLQLQNAMLKFEIAEFRHINSTDLNHRVSQVVEEHVRVKLGDVMVPTMPVITHNLLESRKGLENSFKLMKTTVDRGLVQGAINPSEPIFESSFFPNIPLDKVDKAARKRETDRVRREKKKQRYMEMETKVKTLEHQSLTAPVQKYTT